LSENLPEIKLHHEKKQLKTILRIIPFQKKMASPYSKEVSKYSSKETSYEYSSPPPLPLANLTFLPIAARLALLCFI
jgi:hypothetical protein